MSVHFEHEIEGLKQTLLTMAGHAETAVRQAIKALVERDDDLARQVENDDKVIDRFEKEVDEMAATLLSKAPLANHLRLIIVALKISHDLERVGDEATTIARRSIELSQEPQLKPYVDIPRMAGLALAMLNDALTAFVQHETEQARAVIPRDKEVDGLNKQLHCELAKVMVNDPATISRCLNLMVISKSLERVADHAKNVAEEAVFLFEGRDIRHPAAEAAGSGATPQS